MEREYLLSNYEKTKQSLKEIKSLNYSEMEVGTAEKNEQDVNITYELERT